MIKPTDGSPLHLPLVNSAVCEDFAKIANANGYNTLGEILNIPLTRLIKMDWFTPVMFEELSKVVKQLSADTNSGKDRKGKIKAAKYLVIYPPCRDKDLIFSGKKTLNSC